MVPFWLLVIMIVTLIVLCWGSSYGLWWGMPDGRGRAPGGILGLLGLILLIILILMFVNDIGRGVPPQPVVLPR